MRHSVECAQPTFRLEVQKVEVCRRLRTRRERPRFNAELERNEMWPPDYFRWLESGGLGAGHSCERSKRRSVMSTAFDPAMSAPIETGWRISDSSCTFPCMIELRSSTTTPGDTGVIATD